MMKLAFIEDGFEPDLPEREPAADLFVQFDSMDVSEDPFTIFWGGKRVDHPEQIAQFFTRAVEHLVEDKPFYQTNLYTDQQKAVVRAPTLVLHPTGLQGDIWFVRFELLPADFRPFTADGPPPRFIVWGRIGEIEDAHSDSLGVWMRPADFRALREPVAEFIFETFPREIHRDDAYASLETLAQRVSALV